MALTGRILATVYGTIHGTPPFQGATPFSAQFPFATQQVVSLPSVGSSIFPTTEGIRMGNNYVYSVIVVAPTGLNQQPTQYAASESVATLATNGS